MKTKQAKKIVVKKAIKKPRVIDCKLNKRFHNACKRYQKMIEKNDPLTDSVSNGNAFFASMVCCGLSELDLSPLVDDWKNMWEDIYRDTKQRKTPKLAEAYLAGQIARANFNIDSRVFIIGLPVVVGTDSQYDVGAYREISKILKKFGMKQAGHSYINENSKNKVIALVGQF